MSLHRSVIVCRCSPYRSIAVLRIIIWRMPARLHPPLSGNALQRPVQIECDDGCTPRSRRTIDRHAISAPLKMIIPVLRTWIEECSHLLVERIATGDLRAFTFITVPAGAPEILAPRLPTA